MPHPKDQFIKSIKINAKIVGLFFSYTYLFGLVTIFGKLR